MVEPHLRRCVDELTALVLINPDKGAAAGHDQVVVAVIIDVAPRAGPIAVQPVDTHLVSDLLEAEQRWIRRVDFAVLREEPLARRNGRRRSLYLLDRNAIEELVHRVHAILHRLVELPRSILKLAHP